MAYTEFYCDPVAGSNLNGGSPIGGAYPFTYAAGAWVSGTGVFTVASGNPLADGVQVGDWASVYSGTPTSTGFVGRVLARDATTITVSLVAKTAFGAPATGTCNCKIGGPWQGFIGAVSAPATNVGVATMNAAGDLPRVNFKNNSSYLATLATGFTLPTNVRFQGYAVTPGDGGKFVLDFGGTTSSAYMTVITGELVDAILTGAATSGTGVGAQAGAGSYLLRVVVHGARGSGFVLANDAVAEECEAYGCNLSNDANSAGFFLNGSSRPMASRCYSHDNGSGINARGFAITGNGILLDSIADSNAGSGLEASGISARVFGFAAYNNALDGIRLSNAAYAVVLIENSSLFKNGGYGINGTGAGTRSGQVANCAYGSGTQANTGGNNTGLKSMVEFGAVIYTANGTPWNSPTSGDFRNVGAPVEGAGRGSYTQTGSGKSGTIGYPDIGSAQSKAAAGMILSRVRTGF